METGAPYVLPGLSVRCSCWSFVFLDCGSPHCTTTTLAGKAFLVDRICFPTCIISGSTCTSTILRRDAAYCPLPPSQNIGLLVGYHPLPQSLAFSQMLRCLLGRTLPRSSSFNLTRPVFCRPTSSRLMGTTQGFFTWRFFCLNACNYPKVHGSRGGRA